MRFVEFKQGEFKKRNERNLDSETVANHVELSLL